MTLGVSLGTVAVSISSTGVALFSTTLNLPTLGVSLLNIQVSLVGTTGSAAPPGPSIVIFNFGNATSSMYLPLLGGFV